MLKVRKGLKFSEGPDAYVGGWGSHANNAQRCAYWASVTALRAPASLLFRVAADSTQALAVLMNDSLR